ncbi:MAG: hypothetical protein ABIR98_01325 [Usitatibacter sp.]
MIPCVLLASVPKKKLSKADKDAFERGYYDFLAGAIRSQPYDVILHAAGDQDGGNGGGGEPGGAPMKPSIGELGKTFWDFKYYPTEGKQEDKFPVQLRFELCLQFQDIGYAAAFLTRHSAGILLSRMFTFVQIVALSTPTFVGSDIFGAAGQQPASIGT